MVLSRPAGRRRRRAAVGGMLRVSSVRAPVHFAVQSVLLGIGPLVTPAFGGFGGSMVALASGTQIVRVGLGGLLLVTFSTTALFLLPSLLRATALDGASA